MQLYPHQARGLEETKNMNRVAFYWDMGTGKTFVGSEKLVRLGARVNLVVCQKSKIDDWMEHFETNYDNDHMPFDLTDKDDYRAFTDICTDRVLLENCGNFQLIGIINYELVWRRKALLSLWDFTLLLDESSLIQNETAKRSKFILQMHPKNVILLSGTPTGGKYEKLWSQMNLLGWKISKRTYWNQYVDIEYLDTVGGRSIPIVRGYKKVDRLKKKMAEHGCRFLKTEEVIDLPAQSFIKVWSPTSKAYGVFRKHKLVTVNEMELVGDTTLTRMLCERQLCGQYSAEKLDAFKDLLESTEDRLIVFYNFNSELEALKAICESAGRPYSQVNGAVKDLDAYENESDSVTFLQYQAGAMGLNLQKANKIVYFTLPLSSELFEQSKKRIHRIGQERPCFYYIMLCRGSIEEHILQALEKRRDYTDELFRKDID